MKHQSENNNKSTLFNYFKTINGDYLVYDILRAGFPWYWRLLFKLPFTRIILHFKTFDPDIEYLKKCIECKDDFSLECVVSDFNYRVEERLPKWRLNTNLRPLGRRIIPLSKR